MEPTKPKNFPEPPQQSLYQTYKVFVEKNKKWVVMFLISSALAVICSWKDSPTHTTETPEVDSMIPVGYVLLPIEVENYESLDSVLGQVGLVDLYQNQPGQSRRHLVAGVVRILRNPHNPSQFSILVPEAKAPSITNNFGPYFVSLRPRSSGTNLEQREFKLGEKVHTPNTKEVYYAE